ncbi:MAG: hypothetical protein IPQ08_05865 [Chitinophagaceae bacterium]|nr:hypothetical protein [Chitinophagaceae bacterium]
MACNQSTYNLGIRNIILGSDRVQKTCIFTKADSADSLDGKYFIIHEPVTNLKHVFWINTSGGSAVDPAIPNSTSHAVAITTGASKFAVATAVQGVIDALAWAVATVSGNEVEVTMVTNGYAYEARDALAALSKTEFNISVAQFGSVQFDAGATNGDITFTVEEQTKEIKSPQTGDFLLAEIRRGANVGASFELKDTSQSSIRRALNFYGQTIVTDDAASEVITGYGSNNLFKSTDDVADQVILRPTDKAKDNDSSEDFTIHKSKLKLGELTMSAENELVLPIEVMGYLDTSKSGFANLFSYGNGSALPTA